MFYHNSYKILLSTKVSTISYWAVYRNGSANKYVESPDHETKLAQRWLLSVIIVNPLRPTDAYMRLGHFRLK